MPTAGRSPRNPAYYNFDAIGGDCTNFVSQCLFAGSGRMHYRKVYGWYYNDLNDRAPAWSSVQYLYRFLTTNLGSGPYGVPQPVETLEPGDVVQLDFGEGFAHSLLVVSVRGGIQVAAHTDDSDNRPLAKLPIHRRARGAHCRCALIKRTAEVSLRFFAVFSCQVRGTLRPRTLSWHIR